MKALELADEIEMQFRKGSHHRREIEEAAAELRRLAEVNSIMEKALKFISTFGLGDNAGLASEHAAMALAQAKEAE